jgi:quercetin dioxygenase-like cupin family protein
MPELCPILHLGHQYAKSELLHLQSSVKESSGLLESHHECMETNDLLNQSTGSLVICRFIDAVGFRLAGPVRVVEGKMKRLLWAVWFTLLMAGAVQADDPTGVRVSVLAEAASSWDGTPLPAYSGEAPQITILRIIIPAGTTLPMHKHPVINAGVLLSGELSVFSEDGKSLHLRAGDAVVEVVNKWHYGVNTGAGPAEILVFYAGALETPITVKK